MEKSKTEIYLCRLLGKCEIRARDNASSNDWRLEKYVEAASAMLSNLRKENQPSPDNVKEYTRRIDFLKKLIDSKKETAVDRIVATNMMPLSVAPSATPIVKEIQQKTAAKYAGDVRQELFHSERGEVRHRRGEKSTGEDLEAMLQNHQDTQEKISQDMLMLTRTLREQSQLANQIIKKDTETMGRSQTQIEANNARLKAEAAILAEHNRRAWKCWLWVLLVIVIVVFINMVLFMKVMKKRNS